MATARYRGVQGRKDQNIKKLDRELREAIILKKEDFMKNFHKMVTPLPPSCICEILIQIFSPIFKGKTFFGISVLSKGLLPCETIGTFGTFRYLSSGTFLDHLGHFGPFETISE